MDYQISEKETGEVRRPSAISPDKEIAFSGIQPSGEIHVGNYLGAIKKWVEILDSHYCIFCIVDYHAITVDYDPERMQERIVEAAIANISAGLDPAKCVLFVQSQVAHHTELAWIFNTVTSMGELSRMTQFKEKSQQHQHNVNVGLFDYPVLQAADILLYKATVVPVGEDQVQHIELCRTIARRFNKRFGNVFPMAYPLLTSAKRVMGLDGKSKMSKSLGNHIGLLWDEGKIRQKLRPAFTDPARLRRSDPGHPDVCNIFTMHTGFSDDQMVRMIEEDCTKARIGCVDCKMKLADSMSRFLSPIREKARKLRENTDEVIDILEGGARLCRKIAEETMEEVRKAIGIR